MPSFPNFVAVGPAVVGRPVKLQPVRPPRLPAPPPSRPAAPPLAPLLVTDAAAPLPPRILRQDEEWGGTCTLFIRDVVLSDKVMSAFKEEDSNPITFPTRKAVVPSRTGGDQYVPKP